MESNDYHSSSLLSTCAPLPAGLEYFEHLRKCCSQALQFVIDLDPQRLKDTRCRMDRSRLVSNASSSNCRKVGCTHNGSLRSLAYNPSCHLTSTRLFTIAPENVRQFLFAGLIDEIGSGDSQRLIKSHIERTIGAKGKSALRIIHLVRRESQVKQNTVDRY